MKKVFFQQTLISILEIVMKYNFTNINSSDKPIPAESSTTFVAPHDFVGETRVSRFRISAGAFPLLYIPASTKTYTATQKQAIDETGLTPTDVMIGIFIPYADQTMRKYPDVYTLNDLADARPTNGKGYWFKQTDVVGEQTGTLSVPNHRFYGAVDFPTYTKLAYPAAT